MDALDWAWPSEGTRFYPQDKFLISYGLKLETTDALDSTSAPCNVDLRYSYSKEIIMTTFILNVVRQISVYFFSA